MDRLHMGPRPGFQLHVLTLCWTDLGYRYTAEDVRPILAEISLDHPAFLIDEADIRLYDWQQQELWLTSLAMTRLQEAGGDRLLRDALGRPRESLVASQCRAADSRILTCLTERDLIGT